MKKPGKTFITGRLSESFYLGDIPAESLPERGLSKLLLMVAAHFKGNDWPLPSRQFKKGK
ncbi:hypothetical protein GFS24_14640 [Chitinophaga sp. SYP-B3965]|uniref:hypothetical protein n=1 Tax=Chitinophaga sp. SYP-B3965 TaxID=2663120 RepID=UPI001299ED4E|nr:hypothetical protein [Chitinophaga sp. SYP-B3965]MRG46357.1 hypothetical protein [Chitinophaga sp. SYP-B3965]